MHFFDDYCGNLKQRCATRTGEKVSCVSKAQA